MRAGVKIRLWYRKPLLKPLLNPLAQQQATLTSYQRADVDGGVRRLQSLPPPMSRLLPRKPYHAGVAGANQWQPQLLLSLLRQRHAR
jgi:hypothetical protein